MPTPFEYASSATPTRTSLFSVFANIGFALVKGMAGLVGNSNALIADAVESALDVLSSVVVWSGLRIAALPRDDDHPWGHGKAEPLAGAVVALMLLGAAAGIAFKSLEEISRPHAMPAPFTLAVLLAVILIKEGMFRVMAYRARQFHSTSLMSDAWHHRSDAITSVFALVGITVALVGGPRYASADDVAALLACGVIVFNGIRLLRPAIAELMDAAPDPEMGNRVRAVVAQVNGVDDVETCLVRKTGLEYFVDLHVHVDGNLTVHRGHEIAHHAKDQILAELPQVADVMVHIEPSLETRQFPPPEAAGKK
ncbi:MAG: cation transporter [Candidatus Hydrogenedentes bacterium]|nr:cation transporter [Candidatus Hydrogenedentota bacterium]